MTTTKKKRHSGNCTIFREAIFHICRFLKKSATFSEILGGKKGRKRKSPLSFSRISHLINSSSSNIFQNCLLFQIPLHKQLWNITQTEIFWQGTNDIEVKSCYKSHSYRRRIPPILLWINTTGLDIVLELQETIQRHNLEADLTNISIWSIWVANVKQLPPY